MQKINWGTGGVSELQECDVVDAATREKLFTVNLSFVPRVNEDLDIEAGRRDPLDGLYRVVEVRYHIKRPKLVRSDGLIGVSLYVQRIELRP